VVEEVVVGPTIDGGGDGGGSGGGKWTAVANSTFGTSSINDIAWGGDKFVAVGYDGKMAYSSDGVTWTAVTTSTFGTSDIMAIAYGDGKFVAVGQDNKTAHSSDGVNWIAGGANYTGVFPALSKTIAFGNGRFVTMGPGLMNADIAYSDNNGVTWTNVVNDPFTTQTVISSIAYGKNKSPRL
jgi:hypothetical protein